MAAIFDRVSQGMQKRLMRFIIHKGLEELLVDRLDLQQISISVVDGTFKLKNLVLDPWEINKRLGDQTFCVISGKITELSGDIPLQNLRQGNSHVKVSGLEIEIAPQDDVHFDFGDDQEQDNDPKSDKEAVTLAPSDNKPSKSTSEEADELVSDIGQPREQGLTTLTYMIKTVLANLQGTAQDVKIILHNRKAFRGVHQSALILHLVKLDYRDVTSANAPQTSSPSNSDNASIDPAISPAIERELEIQGLHATLRVWKTKEASEADEKHDVELLADGTDTHHLVSILQNLVKPSAESPDLDIKMMFPALNLMINAELLPHVQNIIMRNFVAEEQVEEESDKDGQEQPEDANASAESSDIKMSFTVGECCLALAFDHFSWSNSQSSAAEFFSKVETKGPSFPMACPSDNLTALLRNVRFLYDSRDTSKPLRHVFQIEDASAFECAWSFDGSRHKATISPVLFSWPYDTEIASLETDSAAIPIPMRQPPTPTFHNIPNSITTNGRPNLIFSVFQDNGALNIGLDFHACKVIMDPTLIDRLEPFIFDPWDRYQALHSPKSQKKSSSTQSPKTAHETTKIKVSFDFVRFQLGIGPPPSLYQTISRFPLGRFGKPKISSDYPSFDLFGVKIDVSVLDGIYSPKNPEKYCNQRTNDHVLDGTRVKIQADDALLFLIRKNTEIQPLGWCTSSDSSPIQISVSVRELPKQPVNSTFYGFEAQPFFDVDRQATTSGIGTFTRNLSETDMLEHEKTSWRMSDICVRVIGSQLRVNCEKSVLDRFYQLVMDLSEWSPRHPSQIQIDSYIQALQSPELSVTTVDEGDTSSYLSDSDDDEDDVMKTANEHYGDGDEDESLAQDLEGSIYQNGEGWESDEISDEELNSRLLHLEGSEVDGSLQDLMTESMSSELTQTTTGDGDMMTSFHPLASVYLQRQPSLHKQDRKVTPPQLRHDVFVQVQFADSIVAIREKILLEEPHDTGTFHIFAGGMSLNVINGYDRSNQKFISLRTESIEMFESVDRNSVTGRLFAAEAVKPPHGIDIPDQILLPIAQITRFSHHRPPGGRQFRMGICMDVNDVLQIQTTTLVMDASCCKLNHRFQNKGHWLMRFVDVVDFPESEWAEDLKARRTGPQFTSLTRLTVNFDHILACYAPISLDPMILLKINTAHITSNIVPRSPMTVLSFSFFNSSMYLLASRDWLVSNIHRDEHEGAGWQSVLSVSQLDLAVRICSDNSHPELDISLQNDCFYINLCADTFLMGIDLINSLIDLNDSKVEAEAFQQMSTIEVPTVASTGSSVNPSRPPPLVQFTELTAEERRHRSGYPDPVFVSEDQAHSDTEEETDEMFESAVAPRSGTSSNLSSPARSFPSTPATPANEEDMLTSLIGQPLKLSEDPFRRPKPMTASVFADLDEASEVLMTPTVASPSQEVGNQFALDENYFGDDTTQTDDLFQDLDEDYFDHVQAREHTLLSETDRSNTPSSTSVLNLDLNERESALAKELLMDSMGFDTILSTDDNALINSYSAIEVEAETQVQQQTPVSSVKTSNCTIDKMIDEPVEVIEDFFGRPSVEEDEDVRSPSFMPAAISRVHLKNLNIVLRLHGGFDFQREPEDIPSTRRSKSPDTCSVLADPGRRDDEYIEINIQKLSLCQETFNKKQKYSSRLAVAVKNLNITDGIPKSYVNLMLGEFSSKDMPRETNATFFRMDMVEVRLAGSTQQSGETILTLNLLPLRLNLDQDAIDFLVQFFAFEPEISSNMVESVRKNVVTPDNAQQPEPTPYFKYVEISSVFIRVDYEPKRVSYSNLMHGEYKELAGVVSLNNAIIALNPVILRGVAGWEGMMTSLMNQYLENIRSNQIPSLIVAGIPGAGSVVSVVQAGANVFSQPVKQYPRVLQGVRDGLVGGVRTTAVEMCNIGTTLSFAMQSALEKAQGLVSESPTRERSRFARQPEHFSDGIQQAWTTLKKGFSQAYSDVSETPQLQTSTQGGSVILRTIGAIPGAGLRPFIAVCEATALAFQGIRNSVSPESKAEISSKYKKTTQSDQDN